jgi:hypothetical protein
MLAANGDHPRIRRLLFRPHELADLDSFCAMEMNREFRRYVGGYARSREDAERKFPKGQLQKSLTDWLSGPLS